MARSVNFVDTMTDERKPEQPLATVEALLAACPVGIALLDHDLRFQQVNDALASIVGRRPVDVIGRSVQEVAPEVAHLVAPILSRMFERPEPVLDVALEGLPRSGPDTRFFTASFVPVLNAASVIGIGAVFVDVTQRRLLEDELRRIATSREQMLAVVTHDLRSPLAAIQLTARLLQTKLPDDTRVRHDLDVIGRSADRMQRLIEDLADGAAVRTGRLSLRVGPEAIDDLLTECLAMNELLAREKGLSLVRADDLDGVTIECDRFRILQVLGNLIANAIKACREHDTITLRGKRRSDREVMLEVCDTGCGMSPAELEVLFEPDPAVARRIKLGLYICKGIVEGHGGRIWADSTPGHGTTISFTLPTLGA